MWPFLSTKTKKLAIFFSEIAERDAKASLQLFKHQTYPQSIYYFQQAVEKASKAYGILAGTLQPTSRDLTRSVRHRSLLGMMLRIPDIMEGLPLLRESLLKSLDQATLKKVGAWDLFSQYLSKKGFEDPEAARKTISQIKRLDAAKLWKISLELDPNHPFTKLVWQRLDEADKKHAEADDIETRFLKRVRTFMGHPEDLDFALNLYGRAGPELFPLGLVSTWHERETRYPPIEANDYWSPYEYTADKGLIKNYPLLHNHTTRLCKAIKAASKAAERPASL